MQHVLYERDDDVAFVRVGQTRFGLCVANPMEVKRQNERGTNLSEMVVGEFLISVQSHDSGLPKLLVLARGSMIGGVERKEEGKVPSLDLQGDVVELR